jgi:GT2 family glycosyltransferase
MIVVVDNKSDSQNVQQLQLLAKDYACVSVILNETNSGYFKGLNIGISFLRENYPEVDWMVVGNNDLEFPLDFADKLASNVIRWNDYAVISPDIITLDGEHQNPHVINCISNLRETFYDFYYSNYYLGMFMLKMRRMFPVLLDRKDEQSWYIAQPIYQGHGSCYLLGPKFFEYFKELWAPTFLMYEEYFLSKQLDMIGEKIFYDPAIQVLHHCHATLNMLPSRQRWCFARESHREYRRHVIRNHAVV